MEKVSRPTPKATTSVLMKKNARKARQTLRNATPKLVASNRTSSGEGTVRAAQSAPPPPPLFSTSPSAAPRRATAAHAQSPQRSAHLRANLTERRRKAVPAALLGNAAPSSSSSSILGALLFLIALSVCMDFMEEYRIEAEERLNVVQKNVQKLALKHS